MAENIVVRTKGFFGSVVEELKKVTWPDRAQLKNSTIVILVFVAIVALIILLMDAVVRNVIDLILGIFSR